MLAVDLDRLDRSRFYGGIMSTTRGGSQWRKWDLHIHTPSSVKNNQFAGSTPEEKWGYYLDKLEEISDISVLGVTDYFSIRGYQRLYKEKQDGRLPNVSLLIPNVELRITPVTGKQNFINIHVLFDPSIVEILETSFFMALEFRYDGNSYRCIEKDLIHLGRVFSKNDSLEENAAYKVGVNQFYVNYEHLRNVLRKHERFTGRYLVGVSNNNFDGNSGIKGDDLKAIRQEIYRLSHFIFSANPADRKYFLGKGVDKSGKVEKEYGSLKPCIHGSDAHHLDAVCAPDKDRFTWIKADTTFEGLRQTIYEPEERVRIQLKNPQYDYPKHYFSSLTIKGKPFGDEGLEFRQAEIPLNRDLITIIGGRGTGKSMILDTLYHTFFKSGEDSRLKGFQNIPFTVRLRKGEAEEEVVFSLSDEAAQFEYLHVRQGHVKRLVDRPADLHKEVRRLLGISSFPPDQLFEAEVARRNEQIAQLREFMSCRDEAGELINTVEYHERQILQNQALLKTLTTAETKQKVDEFTANSRQQSVLETFIHDLERLRVKLNEFAHDTNDSIQALNKRLLDNANMELMSVDFSGQIAQIEKLLEYTSSRQSALKESNQKIETDLAEKGFKGDITNLFSKADGYQQSVTQSEEAKENINTKKKRLENLIQERKDSVAKIKQHLDSERDDIDDRFARKKAGDDKLSDEHKELLNELLKDINIRGTIDFDDSRFVEGLWNFIDGRKFRSTAAKTKEKRLIETLGVKTIDDFFSLLSGKPLIRLSPDEDPMNIDQFIDESELFYVGKEKEFFNYFFLQEYRKKYLHIVPAVTYQEKDLQRISVGQRGTFYLCLKLATESFSTPFLFDQPEDDLDNEFIIKNLIPIFREVKKYRQVIIVTHNANLVVNADSDQIVVATNQNEVLSYEAGALEDLAIRERICDILEGGKKAFLNREQRYGIR